MSLCPASASSRAWRLTLRRFFEPKADDQVPRGAARRPAEVPRPAPAALRRVGHAQVRDLLPVRPGLPDRVHRHGRDRHEGPLPRPLGRRPRRTASGARNRPFAARAGPCPTRRTSISSRSTRGRRRDPRGRTTTTRSDMLADPRGDPGGVRPPARRGAQADQPEDGRLVRDDLRHGLVLPRTFASSRRRRADRRRRRSRRARPVARRRSSRASMRRWPAQPNRTPAARDRPDDDRPARRPAAWPAILLPRGAADPTDLAAARAGAFSGLRRAIRDLGAAGTIATIAGSGPARSRRCRLSDRRQVARPAATAPTAPAALRRRQRLRRRPSSPTDRTLLERDPYAVLEGAAIAAFAIGADGGDHRRPRRGHRRDPHARGRDRRPPRRRHLGDDILGSGRRHRRSTVRTVQGAYMLGEETVLLKALEGKRGQPEQRPPHPRRTRPLRACRRSSRTSRPSPPCRGSSANGAEAFAATGSPTAPGPSSSRSRAPSAAASPRCPFGTPLARHREARGRDRQRPLDQGGPRRRTVRRDPAGRRLLDTPYDVRGRCALLGAHVGSGSIIVADDRACIVDLARLLTRFCADEACGKTIPCRIGTRAPRRDRRADRRRDLAAPDRPPAADRPVRRHRRLGPLRPRAPRDAPARERDAILPLRARRTHPAQLVPGRRLPPDRLAASAPTALTTMAS